MIFYKFLNKIKLPETKIDLLNTKITKISTVTIYKRLLIPAYTRDFLFSRLMKKKTAISTIDYKTMSFMFI